RGSREARQTHGICRAAIAGADGSCRFAKGALVRSGLAHHGHADRRGPTAIAQTQGFLRAPARLQTQGRQRVPPFPRRRHFDDRRHSQRPKGVSRM
ncbi:hypothetical protein LTR94_031774, partial [Friedmanniomyces endolithicus]